MDTKDEIYHQRCIELAKNGLGHVAPNPLVGAVLVADNHIIGEGYHLFFGGPHAEINAINAVKDKTLLQKSSMYVNMEPCVHYGKTPPCVDIIIEKKIPRLFIGHIDPFPEVAGKGIEKLIAAGIEVKVGILENENRYLNKRFLTFYEKKKPYVILKWAETADGFIDISRNPVDGNRPTWITDKLSRTLDHKWRSEEQAILIGTNTALLDNSKLTVRDWPGNNPLRLVLDRTLRLPKTLNLFDKSVPTVVFNEKKALSEPNLEFYKINFSNMIDEIFMFCFKRNIQSIIVEGGLQLLSGFIQSGKWDEARVFKSGIYFENGIKAPEIKKVPVNQSNLSKSILYFYVNT